MYNKIFKYYWEKRHPNIKVRLTFHARKRASEIGLSANDALELLNLAKRKTIDMRMQMEKLEKYGDDYKDIQYYQNGSLLFTVRAYPHEIVVITITDQAKKRMIARQRGKIEQSILEERSFMDKTKDFVKNIFNHGTGK